MFEIINSHFIFPDFVKPYFVLSNSLLQIKQGVIISLNKKKFT